MPEFKSREEYEKWKAERMQAASSNQKEEKRVLNNPGNMKRLINTRVSI